MSSYSLNKDGGYVFPSLTVSFTVNYSPSDIFGILISAHFSRAISSQFVSLILSPFKINSSSSILIVISVFSAVASLDTLARNYLETKSYINTSGGVNFSKI